MKRDVDDRNDAELCDAVREGIGISTAPGQIKRAKVIEEARLAMVIIEDRLGVRREQ